MNLVAAAHQLAWTQQPALWLCESCGILWLVVRIVRHRFARVGVLFMLTGLMLNALVIEANRGHMPVVGMPAWLHPANAGWLAATENTRLAFLADQARLGMFSIGDIVLLCGGALVLVMCVHWMSRTKPQLES